MALLEAGGIVEDVKVRCLNRIVEDVKGKEVRHAVLRRGGSRTVEDVKAGTVEDVKAGNLLDEIVEK